MQISGAEQKEADQPELITAHLELKEALHCPATPSLKEKSPCGCLGLQNLGFQPVPVSTYTMVSNKNVRERFHSAFLPYYLEKSIYNKFKHLGLL